jgi:hypothetical protein
VVLAFDVKHQEEDYGAGAPIGVKEGLVTNMAVKKAKRKASSSRPAEKRSASKGKATAGAKPGRKKLAVRAGAAVSKVKRKAQQIAKGAKRVGAAMSAIGGLIEAGGEAAEQMVGATDKRSSKVAAEGEKKGVPHKTPRKKSR